MDLEEICINAGNWVDSAQNRNLLESPRECGIEPPGSISHGVRVECCGHEEKGKSCGSEDRWSKKIQRVENCGSEKFVGMMDTYCIFKKSSYKKVLIHS